MIHNKHSTNELDTKQLIYYVIINFIEISGMMTLMPIYNRKADDC